MRPAADFDSLRTGQMLASEEHPERPYCVVASVTSDVVTLCRRNIADHQIFERMGREDFSKSGLRLFPEGSSPR